MKNLCKLLADYSVLMWTPLSVPTLLVANQNAATYSTIEDILPPHSPPTIKQEVSMEVSERSEVTEQGEGVREEGLPLGVGPPVFPGQEPPAHLPLGIGPPIFPGVDPMTSDPVSLLTTPDPAGLTGDSVAMAMPVDRSVLEASVLTEDFSCTLCNYQGRSLHCLQKHYKVSSIA